MAPVGIAALPEPFEDGGRPIWPAGLDVLVTVHDVARALPDIPELRARCRALALLDAILSPEWESRYFSFDSRWGPGEEMASMRNGSGDAWSIVFSASGAFVRGFDHGSRMSPAVNGEELWPGLIDSVPESFSGCVSEPAFSYGGVLEATVCLWRQHGDDRWHAGDIDFPAGDDPDGADWLFKALTTDSPTEYHRFAEDYYETTVDIEAVREVFAFGPLTEELLLRLNPDITVPDLSDDIAEIGYSPRRV